MTTTQVNERLMRRVKKALSLAKGNSNESEAQTAMLKAQEMLAKNNLTMSDIDLGEEEEVKKNVIEGFGTDYTKLQWWQKTLASIIGDNFRCYSFFRTTYGKKKVVFMGIDGDVQICVEVYQFAVNCIKEYSKQYVQNRGISGNRSVTNAIKNDYISGFLTGLQEKFAEQVEKENWGLILVKDDAVVERYEGMKFKADRSRSQASRMGDEDAFGSGVKDGKSFNGSRKRLS